MWHRKHLAKWQAASAAISISRKRNENISGISSVENNGGVAASAAQ